jgi:AcrR family transcriptional regulator
MTGLRARVRAELTDEIKLLARRQLADVGAPNLSLRAIARDLGMASSAIYRYFASRDELLTALIIDAYEAIGAEAERADHELGPASAPLRWSTVCRAAYRWALANPADFALIFGTPVPGYVAPVDTIGPAARFTVVLLSIVEQVQADRQEAGSSAPATRIHLGDVTRADIAALSGRVGATVEPELMMTGLHLWISLIGTISFVLFGHLHNVIEDHDAFFETTVRLLGDELFA